MEQMYFSYIIPIVIIVSCSYVLYSSLHSKLAIDPGLIHILVHLFSVSAMILLYIFHFQDVNHYWVLWNNQEHLNSVIYLNAMYVVIFTFVYVSMVKSFGDRVRVPDVYAQNKHIYRLDHFFIVYLIVFSIGILLKLLGQGYLNVYWENVVDLSYMILFALVFSKIKTIKMIIIVSIFVMTYMMFVHYPLLQSEEYVVNRGGVIKIFIFTFVFVHLTGKVNIFTLKRLIAGLIMLPIILGIAQLFEAVMQGTPVGWLDLFLYMGSGYELRMMENQAVILNLLSNNEISERSGDTYLYAILDLLMPTLNEQASPSQWLTEYLNQGTDVKSAYAFSFIAEGILNYGDKGVLIAGVMGALILYFIRTILMLNWSFAPFIYSYLIVLSYSVYRADFAYVSKKIQFTFFSVIILYMILKFVRAVLIKPRSLKQVNLMKIQ